MDVPNLTTVIQTISIQSIQAVKQAYGRLRNLKDKEMRYYLIYCNDIPNQVSYMHSNKEVLGPLYKDWINVTVKNELKAR